MPVRVLLITPEFYGLEKTIKSVLEKSDYDVTWIENKALPLDYHGTNAKFKILRRLYFLLFNPQVRYVKNALKKIENIKFDILFAVNGHIICPYLFRKLRAENRELFSVLYIWDSLSMYDFTKELKFFNKAYTFDSADSIKYQIGYKPNFYVRSSKNASYEIEYDLHFVGKFSPGRLNILDKIMNLTGVSEIRCYVKLWPAHKILLHNRFMYNFLKKFNFKSTWTINYLLNYEVFEGLLKRDYLVMNSICYEEVQNNFLRSNVILDLPYQWQSGYTHRLIEALANGKKIITTNSNITKESFYNPEQVRLLDVQDPEIDNNWIIERSLFPVDSYFSELELSEWVKSIFNAGVA
jgi:hypothetical protein